MNDIDVIGPLLHGVARAWRLKLDELITERFPFERINDAIASSRAGAALRNVVVF